MTRVNTAVLISGRGSNMLALLDAAKADNYPADITLVISNRPEAAGLRAADARGVTALAIDHKDYATRESFERELDAALTAHNIGLVACAGFMRVLTPWFVSRWAGQLINIHPSLLPKYTGLNTHARALEAGDQEAGCTVHWVSEGVDEGATILQSSLRIKTNDTSISLERRIRELEHDLYPQALAIAARRIVQQIIATDN